MTRGRRFVPVVVALCAIGGVTGVQAQQVSAPASYYSCRDANGRMLTSDRPIAECMNREQREHNLDGSVRRVIDPPLTPEQRKARDEEAHRKAEADKLADEQRRHDKILLSSYSSVDALEAARKRTLGDSQAFLDRSRARLTDLLKEKKKLDTEREFYKNGKVPPEVQRKMDDNAFGIRYESGTIQSREDEIAKINARFDADRVRLEQLLSDAPVANAPSR